MYNTFTEKRILLLFFYLCSTAWHVTNMHNFSNMSSTGKRPHAAGIAAAGECVPPPFGVSLPALA